MKEKAKQVLDAVIELLMSGKLIPRTLNQPICNPSYFKKVVKDWGIAIKKVPPNKHHTGLYHHGRKKIYLTTNDRMVFYHELAHAGLMKIMCLWDKHEHDVIAEIVAQTLYFLAHGKIKNLKKSQEYIEYKSLKLKMTPSEILGEVREDAGILLDVILTSDPIFELSVPDKELMYFKTQLEVEIFRKIFEPKDATVKVVQKTESMNLDNDWSVKIVTKKGENQWTE